MAIRGGYQIVNLKGNNLVPSESTKIEGIYESIEGTYKPTLLAGLVINDVEYTDVFVSFFVNAGMFNAHLPFTINGNEATISVSDDDMVIVTTIV